MKSGEHVHFESKWWKSNKAKTLRGTHGDTLTRALTVYEKGLAARPRDLEGMTLKLRKVNLALVGIDKAVKKTYGECDPRFHRQTLDVLQQFPCEIKKKRAEATAILNISLPLDLIEGRIASRGKDSSDDENVVPYIRWLRKQPPATKKKFIWGLAKRLKQMQGTHLRLVQDALREHKTHLSSNTRSAVEKCYSVVAKNLNEARKLTAEAAKCPTGIGIPPKLAAVESRCDAIVFAVRKAKAAMRL